MGNKPKNRKKLWKVFRDSAPLSVAILEDDLTFLEVTRRWIEDYHLEGKDIVGCSYYAVFPDTPDRLKDVHRRCLAGAIERCDADLFPVPGGGQQWLRWEIQPWYRRTGEIGGIIIFTEDITRAKLSEQALQASEERYRALFTHMQTGCTLREIITDDAGRPVDCRFLAANEAYLASRGFRSDEIIGKTLTEIYPRLPNDSTDWVSIYGEVGLTGKPAHFEAYSEASGKWSELTVYRTAPNEVAALVNDINERKQAEQKIQELAYFDGLTNLPNRRLLMDRLGHALAASARSKRQGGLLFVDLDDFKTLNDTLGHAQGDLLLQQVAGRLAACVREGDTVARLGGDEFVVVLESLGELPVDTAEHLKRVGEKVLATLRRPYLLSSQEVFSTASIGAALFGGHSDSLEDLLKRADIAMYQAKSAGRNTLRFFDPALQAAVKARASMEENLRRSIKRGEFSLYYQPQVDGGRLIGAEALLRWTPRGRAMVLPGEFIPLAEKTGLILPLGLWVLENACKQIALWDRHEATRDLILAVNVSVRQFRQPDFVEQVCGVLDRTGANPANLKLELTESMLADNVEDMIGKMAALKSRGLSFSLDDFGTGYSSLYYLKRLPLDQLKIDKSFIHDLLVDANSGAIAQTIIALGRTMGLSVIAEGVETDEQRAFLVAQGCHACQGYLFGRPLPVEDFMTLASTFAADADQEQAARQSNGNEVLRFCRP